MEDFFNFVSRFILVVPLIIIVAAIFIKFGSPKYKDFSIVAPTTPVEPTVSAKDAITVKLNLTGPFFCQFSSKDSSLSAFIKDKKISAKFGSQNFLVRDDCLFIWEKSSYSGEKICGLSNYINLADTFLATNLLNVNTLFNYINQSGNAPKILKNTANLSSFINSCRKEGTIDPSVFDLPRNILFKNKPK